MATPGAVIEEIKSLAPRGVPDIERILDEGTEVAVWNATQGKGTTIAMFSVFISDMVNAFNLYRPMNENQIFELAEDMATDLWFIKFEEIGAFFQAVKKGYIGKVNSRLDPPLVWEFWDEYAKRRMEVIESRQQSKMFSDPGRAKGPDDIRSGKVERLGDAFNQMKEHFKKPL